MDLIIYISIILLIALSFFFSGTETAFTALNIGRLRLEAEAGDKKKKRAYEMARNYNTILYTVLAGNNLVNIAISSLATLSALRILERNPSLAYVKALTVAITSFLIIVFGEIAPKLAATDNPNKFAVVAAGPIKFFIFLFKPLVFVTLKLTHALSVLWKPKKTEPTATEEELMSIVSIIEEEGGFTEQESDLIKSAIEFSEDLAFEILTPRVDVFAVDINSDMQNIVKAILDEEYSRVPVYENSIDNIIGILSTKVFLKAAVEKEERPDIRSMMRPPLFIYKTMSIADTMEEFKKNRAHMAVVLDEFGGTLGIVTLEDVLEQLVGDIWDETDEQKNDMLETEHGVYEVSGDMFLDDFFDIIGYKVQDYQSEYTTLGGLAIEMLGHFPEEGESFTFDGHIMEILEVNNMRVEKVKVVKNDINQKD